MTIAARFFIAIATFFLFATVATAAPRTVCFNLRFADDRNNCPAPANGVLRGCQAGSDVDAIGHQIELWDKDQNSPDDLIGTWYVNGGGTQCATFEWERSAASLGEHDPDVYMRYINRVNQTGFSNYVFVQVVRRDGGAHPATTWRNGQPGDPDRYVANNCTAGSTCYMFPSGYLLPTSDVASERAQRIMTLDSAQHMLQVYSDLMNRNVKLHFPGKDDCTTSCATDRENYHIFKTQGRDGILSTHELGHVLQMQIFGQDSLTDDVSKGGNGWSLTSDEFDSGATTEGWASYVAVVSWFDPNNSASNPVGWSVNFDAATPTNATCSNNRGIPLQVARAFWDIDDWNNEAGAGAAGRARDALAYGTLDIARGWQHFADGSGNRQNDESDMHGLNARDYYWNNTWWLAAPEFFETFIEHNCLQDQDNN
ncbi:hypothetical protein FHT86_005543 [Rhizobium sp. BK313]|uniref:hypothetical protein n=1 Tax=Rhizobium sp. BK313 TaxID=2587081 RepID=UPI00105B2B14|nr:hypothetical protein [Rhizobium sp. BK313]MBB3457225.1 hypothetical protein [Rhizobium sp. BK313]